MILMYGIYGVNILKLQDQPPTDQLSPLSTPTVIDDYFFAIYFNRAILSTMDLAGLSRINLIVLKQELGYRDFSINN